MTQEFINDVNVERWRYIGGSDIPVIMDLSPFKTREELLREKAFELDSEFEGNAFTEYGHIMEPKIREYINNTYGYHFQEYREVSEGCRIHLDGYDEVLGGIVLEVKTTGTVKDTEEENLAYKVQLLYYMEKTKAKKGLLAIYNRPEDFSEEFDEDRLTIIFVEREDNQELIQQIMTAVDNFEKDKERLKTNPELTSEDLIPEDLQQLAIEYKKKKEESEALKKEADLLANLMIDRIAKEGRKKLKFDKTGFQITRTAEKPERHEMVEEFDLEAFKQEHHELLGKYMRLKMKKISGRKATIRITNQEERT